jgi:GH24 family phage-related lysozyme (muramidase)
MTYQNTKLFDTFRRILGRGFSQAEVDQINAALESRITPDRPSVNESPDRPGRVSPAGIKLIHEFESCARKRPDGRFAAYPDPGSKNGHPWTIGWGATGAGIVPGTVWTQAQCDERFAQDIVKYADAVTKALGPSIAKTSQPMFDALVSFHYNTGAIEESTLTRKHIAGDHAGAANEFKRWVRNDGKVLKGLVRRRAAEEALYRSGMSKA